MTKILVGTPCYNGVVTTHYLSSILRLQHILFREKIEFSLVTTATESLITRARNFIVSQFLDRKDFTHLLFIDLDIGFDPTIVLRYLNAAKDIVAGIYPLKHLDLETIRASLSNALRRLRLATWVDYAKMRFPALTGLPKHNLREQDLC